ncbi:MULTISPECIES: signal peptidase I [Kitasatospora]|uniref:Signal peptidase I n=1 Tax=Kitasatospora cineracea TaxID=88074 RepID=A0A8G1UF49_9ACTN|nr:MULTISPECIES: signal peptidase I [Kitasatospora]ROR41924.1 signal peptidase I [Kitasatospora cineracea]WAL74017.1 signal peptidase I [Kitasatospora sp. YST-16]WNW40090.1 signal peptidase I [Streptomyces sp. Li-HN-5-13]
MGDLVIGARSGAPEPDGEPVGNQEGLPAGDGEELRDTEDGAEATGDSAATSRKAPKQRSFWKELPILIGIALILALVIKTFFVQAFSIPSGSMENTLQVGDRVLVDKLTPWFGSEPERGEVVVFKDPGGWLNDEPTQRSDNSFVRGVQDVFSFIGLMPSSDEKDLIKRVIAVGGDTVECQGSGPVKVNGVALDEPYIFPGNTPCGEKPFGPVNVPKGTIWVMGDHRGNSLDSRYHMDQPGGGTVPVGNVVGRAFVVAWPIGDWATLPVPDTFDQKGLAAGPLAPAMAGTALAVPAVWWVRRRRR